MSAARADAVGAKTEAPPSPTLGTDTLSVSQSAEKIRRKLRKYTQGLGALAQGGLPDEMFYYGAGIGDDLLCTAIFRERAKRGAAPANMVTAYPALFAGSPDVARVLTLGRRFVDLAARLGRTVVIPDYNMARNAVDDQTVPPPCPIIARMCELSGIAGPIDLRPYLWLADAEKAPGRLSGRQVAIQSGGLAARFPMRNKQWQPEKFQAVVDALKGRFDFVHVGDPSDTPLDGVRDLRGRTGLRETAAILSQSLCFIGQVGFPMHLSRAVDCRAVIVYGGRERPDQSGYAGNENLYTPLPCAPCWRENTCDFGHECMRRIGPDMVIEAVLRQSERAGEPFPAQSYTVPG